MVREHDSALVRRAKHGDRDAFAALMRRHQDRVYALVRGIVRDPHEAADVTQEVFIAVLQHLDGFREGSAFTTWLHRIAVRRSLDHCRRRRPEPVDPASWAAEHVAVAGNPHENHLMQQDLLAAIAELDESFRAAVLLVDVLGYSVDEAAGVLDVAAGTVKSRVFRGRALLSRNLGTSGHRGASNS